MIDLPLLHLIDAVQINIVIRGYAVLTQQLLLLIGLLYSIFAIVSAVQIPLSMLRLVHLIVLLNLRNQCYYLY